ncbi:asparagine synthase (glutamine-hydrolyzing) [Larkinella rosea]|uniref:asparagine synthase (glutamine-hydrolyzing) n=1 Tax=Larkinella rosea TaxID=2025312 RepID=A0A3P1BJ81_9BACT|nr:asparagine synthase (glutamine-hydrolyzing) [Larkinella rosea]RRB00883.1 asparagine synthase (glutamine-hydrolyzing) [Larkinella rosea]
MCGIAGIVGSTIPPSVDLRSTIRHRGPDGEGLFNAPGIQLAQTRLAILDLTPNGKQPMQTADGRYVIIFNGEIYNHLTLRAALTNQYIFRSTSDTETLLYGFATYGTAVFRKLNGIFACAIFDTLTRQLVLARDQFGVKPLYYYHEDGLFLFSSELKTIAGYPCIDKSIDYSALVNYLHFLYSPGMQTPFQHVNKLLPGHYIQLSVDEPTSFAVKRYYDLPFRGMYSEQSESQLLEELDERLFTAVKRQLQSDVPLAFFLSGGLDSSLVMALAKRAHPNERLTGYTIRTAFQNGKFEGFENDLPYARQVATHLNVDLVEVDADADIIRDFDRMIYHLDEPQADTAPFNVLNICRQARQNGHTVLLGGTAGDDVFSGYRRHQALTMEPYLNRIPPVVGRLLNRTVSLGTNGTPLLRRLRKLTAGMGQPQQERMADYFARLPIATNHNLFESTIGKTLHDYQPSHQLLTALERIPDEKNLLNQLLFWELSYFLPDHNLNYTDKMSMAVGVETRVPFLDTELVEFSTKLPPSLKMRGRTTKYLLRKLAERYLPHSVIYRPKTGFGTPLRDWLRTGQLDGMLKGYLSDESLRQRGIFDPVAVHQLIRDNKNGKIDATYSIWGLMAIESWFRQFVDPGHRNL